MLPDAPVCHTLKLTEDIDADALSMRKYLKLSEVGPVGILIELLENRGVLVYMCGIDQDAFSGMNGLVNERPYIIVNSAMSPERIRRPYPVKNPFLKLYSSVDFSTCQAKRSKP